MDTLNPHFLRTFVRAFELLNFTQTAKELALTQSGVSQHIGSLEETLRKKLFERVGKSVYPTEHAHKLYGYSKALLLEMGEFIQSVKLEAKDVPFHFCLATPGEYGQTIAENWIEFQKNFPNSTIKLEYAPSYMIGELVKNATVDFGIVNDLTHAAGLKTAKVFDEELVLVTGRTHKKEISQPKDLLDISFIDHPNGPSLIHQWFQHYLPKEQTLIPELKMGVSVNNLETIRKFLVAGLGAAIVSKVAVQDLISSNQVIVHYLGKKKTHSNSTYLIHRQEDDLSIRKEKLNSILKMQ